jgi:hypothetical protein
MVLSLLLSDQAKKITGTGILIGLTRKYGKSEPSPLAK